MVNMEMLLLLCSRQAGIVMSKWWMLQWTVQMLLLGSMW